MVGASDNLNRLMQDLKQSFDDWSLLDRWRKMTAAKLMEMLEDIRMGVYPEPRHERTIREALDERVSPGTVVVWRERKW